MVEVPGIPISGYALRREYWIFLSQRHQIDVTRVHPRNNIVIYAPTVNFFKVTLDKNSFLQKFRNSFATK